MNSARGRTRRRARPRAAARARARRRPQRAQHARRRRRRWRARRADPAAPRRRPGRLVLLYPFVASPFFTYQIGAPVARARPDRALAHLPRRLRRHGLAGADDGRRARRLHGRDLRHAAARRRSASAGRGGSRCRSRSSIATAVRDRGRLALGAHRGHLHDHDHARDRRRLLLPGAAELHRLQRLPGLQQGRRAGAARHRLPRAGALLLSRAGCALAGYFFVRHLRARAVRHRPAGHPRQPAPHACAGLTTSPRTASRPTRWRACSPRSAAC